MNRIAEYLSDPGWWFTAVFVAVLASLAAGFLKDTVLLVLAKVSSAFKVRKQKRDAEFEKEVNELLTDRSLLVLTWCALIVRTCALLTLITIYTISAIVYISILDGDVRTHLALASIVLLSGGGVMFGMVHLYPRQQVMNKAYREYRKRALQEGNRK